MRLLDRFLKSNLSAYLVFLWVTGSGAYIFITHVL